MPRSWVTSAEIHLVTHVADQAATGQGEKNCTLAIDLESEIPNILSAAAPDGVLSFEVVHLGHSQKGVLFILSQNRFIKDRALELIPRSPRQVPPARNLIERHFASLGRNCFSPGSQDGQSRFVTLLGLPAQKTTPGGTGKSFTELSPLGVHFLADLASSLGFGRSGLLEQAAPVPLGQRHFVDLRAPEPPRPPDRLSAKRSFLLESCEGLPPLGYACLVFSKQLVSLRALPMDRHSLIAVQGSNRIYRRTGGLEPAEPFLKRPLAQASVQTACLDPMLAMPVQDDETITERLNGQAMPGQGLV